MTEESKVPPTDMRFLNNICVVADIILEINSKLKDSGVESPVNDFIITMGKAGLIKSDSIKAINVFISKTAQHWESIRKKEEIFLRTYMAESMFVDLEQYKDFIGGIPTFFELITNDEKLSELKERDAIVSLREEIWVIMHACVKVCITYIHECRKQITVVTKDESGAEITKTKYTETFFPDLSIKKLRELWK